MGARALTEAPSGVYFASLRLLAQWCERGGEPGEACVEPLAARPVPARRLLVCHDFAGGYRHHEDACARGYFPHPSGSRYAAAHLAAVHTFVYFAHHRVLPPPVVWTAACHRSGVPCLGTVIVENDPDACADMLRRHHGVFVAIPLLVRLMEMLRFDGYLLNWESTVPLLVDPEEVVAFVGELTQALHRANPRAQLVWYDLFEPSNNVHYENGLATANLRLYHALDAFFTNYAWTEANLIANTVLGGDSTSTKVYVGVDVWGRVPPLCHSGWQGKEECGKAVAEIARHLQNAALFAPAWSYEECPQEYHKRDARLWAPVMRSMAPVAATTPTADGWVFYTNFSTGEGQQFYEAGAVLYPHPWVHTGLQFPQPECGVVQGGAYSGDHHVRASNTRLFTFDQDTAGAMKVRVAYRCDADARITVGSAEILLPASRVWAVWQGKVSPDRLTEVVVHLQTVHLGELSIWCGQGSLAAYYVAQDGVPSMTAPAPPHTTVYKNGLRARSTGTCT